MSTQQTLNNGGPAFPRRKHHAHRNPDGSVIRGHGGHPGMSLRDWFAGQALGALLSEEGYASLEWPKNIATDAYKIASAMISEREKEVTK